MGLSSVPQSCDFTAVSGHTERKGLFAADDTKAVCPGCLPSEPGARQTWVSVLAAAWPQMSETIILSLLQQSKDNSAFLAGLL